MPRFALGTRFRTCAVLLAALVATLPTVSPIAADDWPQWLGPRRDGVLRESGLLEKFPDGGPKLLWRVPCGMGYSGPAVVGGRVFLTDRVLAAGASNPDNPFNRKARIPGSERIWCLDAKTGQVVWSHEYDCPYYQVSYAAGPRCTPLVADGRVYVLGTMGNLLCLDAEKGRVIWSRDFRKDFDAEPPVWGFSANPLLDGQRLICLVGGEKNSAVVAFDAASGQELWRSLSTPDIGYGPPMIYEFAGRRQLIIWHVRAVEALDPQTGKPLWKHDWNVKAALTAPTVRQIDDKLFLTAFYDGSLMLRPAADSAPEVVWKRAGPNEKKTEALHAIMATPFVRDGHIYGVCSYGQLRCLKADTGERVWETLEATTPAGQPVRWANAFLTPTLDGRCFLFNEFGELILARLTPEGYQEISRAKLLEPTNPDAKMTDPKRLVVWSHPAYADRCVFVRNDKEIVCASLAP